MYVYKNGTYIISVTLYKAGWCKQFWILKKPRIILPPPLSMDLYVIQEQLFFSTPKFPYVKWTPCIIVLVTAKENQMILNLWFY